MSEQRWLGVGGKYDDWICTLCHNHNYSFRQICNRCRVQTKEQNSYIWVVYQQQLQEEYQHQQQLLLVTETHQGDPQELFPTVLLLMIDDQPWEEQPQRCQTNKTANDQWINHLIQD